MVNPKFHKMRSLFKLSDRQDSFRDGKKLFGPEFKVGSTAGGLLSRREAGRGTERDREWDVSVQGIVVSSDTADFSVPGFKPLRA